MAISFADFGSFITELVTRNPTMGIPALEDGLFANLWIFDYLYYIFFKRKGKREGKRERGINCIVVRGGERTVRPRYKIVAVGRY